MKSIRKVTRRPATLHFRDIDYPLNPNMEQALVVKLQDFHFKSYTDGLHDFISRVAPYYHQTVSFEDSDEATAEPTVDIEWYNALSAIFQELVIAGAALDDTMVQFSKGKLTEHLEGFGLLMPDYGLPETRYMLEKHFYAVMYQHGFIDEINLKLRIPSFRFRTRNGQNLSFAPSFPLHAFASQLAAQAKITQLFSSRLIENFSIFYWNLRSVPEKKKMTILSKYLAKVITEFDKTEKTTRGKEIFIFIQDAIDDLFDA